jgi:ABC-type amino acid transport substrate-binding protein
MQVLFAVMVLWISIGVTLNANADDKIIRINYSDAYPPLSYGQYENVRGVLPELMNTLISEKMGYEIINAGKAWKRAQEEVWKGRADLLITASTPKRLERSYQSQQSVFTLTFRPYTKVGSPAAKALAKTDDISSLGQFRFCDVHGNQWGQRFYSKHKIDFHVTRSFESCLRLLTIGRADIIVHSDHILSEIIKNNGWEQQITAHPYIMPESPKFYLLLSKKSFITPAFLTKFDKIVEQMRGDGSYTRLLRELNMTHGVSMAKN